MLLGWQEYLPTMHKTLVQYPASDKLDMMAQPCNPSPQEVEQEDQNFQVTLNFEADLEYLEPSFKKFFFQSHIFV